MKLSDFILLNEKEKKLTLLHQGVLVGKRVTESSMVFLFQLEDYYVESYCSLETKAIEEFRIFKDLEPLSPYLEAIQLEDLLS